MTETASLALRLARLEKQLTSFREITGVDPATGPNTVTVLSINRDTLTGGYFISFASQPGETYQVQSSVDAVAWAVADSSVNAADSPALSSTWLSPPYDADTIVYFRVRRYPRTMALPDLTPTVNLSPPLADTPTLQQILALMESIQSQIDALTFTPDVSTRLRDIHTAPQLAAALAESGELILRLKAPITLPAGNTTIPSDKIIEFGLHWFEDVGGSTVSFWGLANADRRMIFSGFTASDIVGTFGGTDVFPEWWGLVADNHDIAINCAVRASSLVSNGYGLRVSLGPGDYDVSSCIDLSSTAVTLEGCGSNITRIVTTSAWVDSQWIKCAEWGVYASDVPNHGSVIWMGAGVASANSFRTKVKGFDIVANAATFANWGVYRISGISSRAGVEECSVIHDITVSYASGFGIGFGLHKNPDTNIYANSATVNGLDISSCWILGATYRDARPLHHTQWSNNCSVRNVTVDVGLAKSLSSQHATDTSATDLSSIGPMVSPTDWPVPAHICDYPEVAITAQGYITLSDIHIEGAIIGVKVQENTGANNIVINNLKCYAMMDPVYGGVYELDGTFGDGTVPWTKPPANTDYYDYACAVLIGGQATTTVGNNFKDCVTINGISTNGACGYLVRDTIYGVEMTSYDQGQFPNGDIGGRMAFYARGNPYTGTGGGATYNKAAPSTDRSYFLGPIY